MGGTSPWCPRTGISFCMIGNPRPRIRRRMRGTHERRSRSLRRRKEHLFMVDARLAGAPAQGPAVRRAHDRAAPGQGPRAETARLPHGARAGPASRRARARAGAGPPLLLPRPGGPRPASGALGGGARPPPAGEALDGRRPRPAAARDLLVRSGSEEDATVASERAIRIEADGMRVYAI